MVGSAVSQTNVLKKATRRFHFCVGNVDTSASAKDIQEHVSKFIQKINSVDEIQIKSKKHKLFKVCVDDTYESLMLNPANWPSGIRIKRFNFPKTEAKPVSVNKDGPNSEQNNATENVEMDS